MRDFILLALGDLLFHCSMFFFKKNYLDIAWIWTVAVCWFSFAAQKKKAGGLFGLEWVIRIQFHNSSPSRSEMRRGVKLKCMLSLSPFTCRDLWAWGPVNFVLLGLHKNWALPMDKTWIVLIACGLAVLTSHIYYYNSYVLILKLYYNKYLFWNIYLHV